MKKAFRNLIMVVLIIGICCPYAMAASETTIAPSMKPAATPNPLMNFHDKSILNDLSDKDILALSEAVIEEMNQRGIYPFIELKKGDKGQDVTRLQTYLHDLGYLTSQPTGSFDSNTQQAMKAMEKANNQKQDGVASIQEQQRLANGLIAHKPTPSPKPTPKPTKTPKPTPVPTPNYKQLNYKNVARNPNQYKGQYAKFSGRVIQQIDIANSSDIEAIIYIGSNSNNIMYLRIDGFKDWTWDGVFENTGVSRLLKGDRVVVKGTMLGSYTYTTVQDVELTVPYMDVEYMTLYQ